MHVYGGSAIGSRSEGIFEDDSRYLYGSVI